MILRLNTDGLTSLDSAVSDFFETRNLLDSSTRTRDIVPALNVYEDEDRYTIEVAIPGMNKEDFSVKIEDRILTISAEAMEDEEEEDGEYAYQEYSYNSFSRSFPLPEDASEEGIDAYYEDGELIISIPKIEEWVSKGHEIEIH
jgi:HSP20 family protein